MEKVFKVEKGHLQVVRVSKREGSTVHNVNPSNTMEHLRGITSKDHPFNGLSKGDQSALKDASSEYKKELAKKK